VKTEINVNTEVKEVKEVKHENVNLKKKIKPNKPEIDNLVKDIEYLTTDKNGNKYKILATSGRTNSEDKNILDLDNVRGVITSDEKSTVYILSDFAEYNSFNLNSNFYQNVVINYEDKEITCDYFNVDMQTNIAIAYNNVVVTDPQSIMKAGKIILNIETKVININPENEKKK
jgi:LPS export ABC transporter protein LptC